MKNDNGNSFWSGVFKTLDTIAVIYLAICLYGRFEEWSFKSKFKSWVFLSVLASPFALVFTIVGLAALTVAHVLPHFGGFWLAPCLFVFSADAAMIWAARDIDADCRKRHSAQRMLWGKAGCRTSAGLYCAFGIPIVSLSILLAFAGLEAHEAHMYDSSYSYADHGSDRSHVWVTFPEMIDRDDNVLNLTNYYAYTFVNGQNHKPLRSYSVKRIGYYSVDLEVEHIPTKSEVTESTYFDVRTPLADKYGRHKIIVK